FNPYGDPANTSPAMRAHIGSGYSWTDHTTTVTSANLKADGSLLELAGGPLRVAVGVDLRGERFETEGENFLSGIAPRIVAPLVYERDVSAAFVEFRAPFV
ncbi:hypothetical protein K4A07_19605, partial [Lactiplantibacillus plantarum]|nr:hypothetical protein [Lactiplantibacillus plantarum]